MNIGDVACHASLSAAVVRGKDAKVAGLICPHCKGDHFEVIADIVIGKVPYVYITDETIAVGFECWTCGEQYLIK